MDEKIPIEASGSIPLSQNNVAAIPSIATSIPDIEGQAILRLFTNSTRSEVGCYVSALTNGATFSHPRIVGGILVVVVLVALISSATMAIHGTNPTTMRNHYANSMSVWVAFMVFHHIYFTGALSLNWPSVLVAFWSNYAWFAGMIYSQRMQNAINLVVGTGDSNIEDSPGYSNSTLLRDITGASNLDRRSITEKASAFVTPYIAAERSQGLAPRDTAIDTHSSKWQDVLARQELPPPGSFFGFPGTLSLQKLPAPNAFLTGLLWVLSLIAILIAVVPTIKLTVELFNRMGIIKTSRLDYFRANWLAFLLAVVARTVFISFFMLMFLALFQFSLRGSPGALSISAIVCVLLLLGMCTVGGYVFFNCQKGRTYRIESTSLVLERRYVPNGQTPRYGITMRDGNSASDLLAFPWWRLIRNKPDVDRLTPHQDEQLLKKFGWLTARFNQNRWWYFALWLVYELVRASFLGGAANHTMTQVFGLLVLEIISMAYLAWKKPFESRYLNIFVVYILGISKIITLALSATFSPRFGVSRVATTIIGIVIIVIQGLLTICLIVAILAGAVSSYISLTRGGEHGPFNMDPSRTRQSKNAGVITGGSTPVQALEAGMKITGSTSSRPEQLSSSFNVTSVRRVPKIEDEDPAISRSRGPFDFFDPEYSVASPGPARQPSSIYSRESLAIPDEERISLSDLGYPVHLLAEAEKLPVPQKTFKS